MLKFLMIVNVASVLVMKVNSFSPPNIEPPFLDVECETLSPPGFWIPFYWNSPTCPEGTEYATSRPGGICCQPSRACEDDLWQCPAYKRYCVIYPIIKEKCTKTCGHKYICGTVEPTPEPCRPSLCGCRPGTITVTFTKPDGCEGCRCRPRMNVGGLSKVKPADEETQQLLQGLKGEIEDKLNEIYEEFTLISYATQVVAGTNYFAKIRVGTNKYIHIRVNQHWSGSLALHGVQKDKNLGDTIEHFQE